MKRFLILSILAAFLAIPAISMAYDFGSGTVPSATVTASSVHNVQGGQTTVMQTQSFAFKTGYLAFSEMSSVTFHTDNGGSKYFNGQVVFAGPAKASDGSQLSNLFINMSGFTISAKATPKAETGQGAIYGTVTHTDNPAKGGDTQPVNFTGAYNMSVALTGATTANGGNPTGGTVTATMTLNPIIANQPVVLTVTMPATKFTILGSLPPPGTLSNWSLNYTTTSGPASDGPYPTPPKTDALSLTQYGSDLIGTINDGGDNPPQILGTIVGTKFNATFSYTGTKDQGSDGNGGEIYQITTTTRNLTGTLAPGSAFGVSGAKMTGAFTSTVNVTDTDNGNVTSSKTTAGDKGTWNATVTP